MNADGSGQTRLANLPGVIRSPVWSPDGCRIAFGTWQSDGNDQIYVMNADGSGQTNLTKTMGNDDFPAWSPAIS
jgi:TolB protein